MQSERHRHWATWWCCSAFLPEGGGLEAFGRLVFMTWGNKTEFCVGIMWRAVQLVAFSSEQDPTPTSHSCGKRWCWQWHKYSTSMLRIKVYYSHVNIFPWYIDCSRAHSCERELLQYVLILVWVKGTMISRRQILFRTSKDVSCSSFSRMCLTLTSECSCSTFIRCVIRRN